MRIASLIFALLLLAGAVSCDKRIEEVRHAAPATPR